MKKIPLLLTAVLASGTMFGQFVGTSPAPLSTTSTKVGIGTATPTSGLTVYAPTNLPADQQIRIGTTAVTDYTIGRNPGTGYLNFFGSQVAPFAGYTFMGGPMGIGTVTPGQQLTVTGGNIDVNTATNGYMLNNQMILWNRSGTGNLFAGIGAGTVHANSNSNNTFVGGYAGFSHTGGGGDNVFLGTNAGYTSVNTSGATLLGYRAGYSFGNINGATFVGWNAGSNSVGVTNSFFGYSAGMNNNTGIRNSFFGHSAGMGSTGDDNCFFGVNSGTFNNTKSRNTYYGTYSGATSAGEDNTFIGWNTGNWGAGNKNVAIGSRALMTSSGSADENVAIGFNASANSTSGNFNTYMGSSVAFLNNTGTNNTFIGYKAAYNQTTGANNASLGTNTGLNVTNGNNNTFVGANADANTPSSTLTNASAIGSNAKVLSNNTMILGDNNVNVGIGLSGVTPAPGNKLELNTPNTATTANPLGGTGFSGLRFRDLNTSSTPATNPGTGLLAVDANGDVIYVNAPASSAASLGNKCSGPANPLLTSWTIPLNGNDFYFADDNVQKDKVHVGYSCTQGIGKFNVQTKVASNPSNPIESYSIHSMNTYNNPSGLSYGTGVYGEAKALSGSSFEKGVWGKASATRQAIGVYGEADLCVGQAYGGYFLSVNANNNVNFGMAAESRNAGNTNYGVHSEATGGKFTWGGYFEASTAGQDNIGVAGIGYSSTFPGPPSYPSGSNIGVYGEANPNVSGAVGTDWAGWFDGDVNINGIGYITSGVWNLSDKRFKKDIKPLEGVTEKIKKLSGYTYNFRVDEFKNKNFDNAKHIGFIAQELKEVFPELVREDKNGFYSVNYEGMVPVLLEAAKSQQSVIESQQEQLSSMQQQIDELRNLVKSGSSLQSAASAVELSDESSIVLEQNVPNPFAEETSINYVIPASIHKAQILFYNASGQLIKSADITERGAGKLNVFASNLSSGMYTYTLIADGKVIETKKMEKQK